jgi:hypothetical protein
MNYWVARGKIRVALPGPQVPTGSLHDVLEGKCMCGGDLDRVAFRDRGLVTRPWTAFGYRCYSCETVYMDAKP